MLFFFQAEDGIRDRDVTGVQTCALPISEPFIKTRQKNPDVAINAEGDRLIVWGEAISHTRGGRLNMQLFAADGAVKSTGFAEEVAIPNFSFPAAAQLKDGDFLVLY